MRNNWPPPIACPPEHICFEGFEPRLRSWWFILMEANSTLSAPNQLCFILHVTYSLVCFRCNKEVTALKRLSIRSSPNILVLHLKRFDFLKGDGSGGVEKVNKFISFDFNLSLAKFLSLPVSFVRMVYRCLSVKCVAEKYRCLVLWMLFLLCMVY